MKIANIIFDLGGVVLSEDDGWLYSSDVKNLLLVDDATLTKGWEAAWPPARNGKYSEDEFFSVFLQTTVGEVKPEHIDKLKTVYRKFTTKGGAFPMLSKLKGRYKLFALTNISRDWLKYKLKHFDLNKYFELIVSSATEGIGKPNPEIYEALIKKGNINPLESVFIDNFERNLKPAEKLGFNTILFTTMESCILELKKLNINL